jgi:hypothetical protein
MHSFVFGYPEGFARPLKRRAPLENMKWPTGKQFTAVGAPAKKRKSSPQVSAPLFSFDGNA